MDTENKKSDNQYYFELSPKCPHCDYRIGSHEEEELWDCDTEIYDEGHHELDCPMCHGKVFVQTVIQRMYHTFTEEQE